MHPARLRCSSLEYSRYSRSSRLAARSRLAERCSASRSAIGSNPRRSRCFARLLPRAYMEIPISLRVRAPATGVNTARACGQRQVYKMPDRTRWTPGKPQGADGAPMLERAFTVAPVARDLTRRFCPKCTDSVRAGRMPRSSLALAPDETTMDPGDWHRWTRTTGTGGPGRLAPVDPDDWHRWTRTTGAGDPGDWRRWTRTTGEAFQSTHR